MNRNYISTASLYDSGQHLAHYGVLGMKWGVRRDRQRAYQKATAKRDKLYFKSKKYKEKAINTRPRAAKYEMKYRKAQSRGVPLEEIPAYRKAAKIMYKALVYDKKAQRYISKAEKWEKSMAKVFSETSIPSM